MAAIVPSSLDFFGAFGDRSFRGTSDPFINSSGDDVMNSRDGVFTETRFYYSPPLESWKYFMDGSIVPDFSRVSHVFSSHSSFLCSVTLDVSSESPRAMSFGGAIYKFYNECTDFFQCDRLPLWSLVFLPSVFVLPQCNLLEPRVAFDIIIFPIPLPPEVRGVSPQATLEFAPHEVSNGSLSCLGRAFLDSVTTSILSRCSSLSPSRGSVFLLGLHLGGSYPSLAMDKRASSSRDELWDLATLKEPLDVKYSKFVVLEFLPATHNRSCGDARPFSVDGALSTVKGASSEQYSAGDAMVPGSMFDFLDITVGSTTTVKSD